jgi:hypothetical protein
MDHLETVAQARDRVRANAEDGCTCPCCGQLVKVYRRRIHREMVLFLARLQRACDRGRNPHAFYGPRDIRGDGAKASTDGTFLRHWGLIECEIVDGAPKRGRYRITARGRLFINGGERVPAVALFLCGDCIGFEEGTCTASQCYGEAFDYRAVVGVL